MKSAALTPGQALADKSVAQQMNLSVLQRIDPSVDQILSAAGHVALYKLDQETSSWTQRNVEGSLFLLSRQTEPHYRIFILNKKSQENYVEDVLPGLSTELTPPYLYFTNQKDEVLGIWFFEVAECVKLDDWIGRLRDKGFKRTKLKGPAAVTSAQKPEENFWDKLATTTQADGDARLAPAPASAAPAMGDQHNDLTRLFANCKIRAPLPPIATSPAVAPTKREPPAHTPFPGFPPLYATSVTDSTAPQVIPGPTAPSTHGLPAAKAQGAEPQASPLPAKPGLLTPSFFQTHRQQAAASPAIPSKPPDKVAAGESDGDVSKPAGSLSGQNGSTLSDLFARAVKPAGARHSSADGGHDSEQSTRRSGEFRSPAASKPVYARHREQVRQAILALAKSDQFVDQIASQFAASGVLRE